MPESSISSTRGIAAAVVASLMSDQGSLNTLLPAASARLSGKDRAFVAELCFGTARYYHRLQALLDRMLTRPLKAKDGDIKALLLIGIYQMDYLRVPDHAAISATVAATSDLRKPWAKALVNGVLRNYQRSGAELRAGLEPAQAASHPQWLWQALQRQWPGQWREIVAANSSPPPMTLRVNAVRTSTEDYRQLLADAGIEASHCAFSPWGLQLSQPRDVHDLPGFDQGLCSVQDEASQLVAPLLKPSRGMRLLDCCCAPGGKTGHLLELGGDGLAVDAIEIDGQRLARVASNLERLGLSARLIEADLTRVSDWWDGRPYNAILLDAPCSATGVIRRHPDIKLLRKPADIARLAAAQEALLQAVWPCLEPGGMLIYSTCSILREENDDVVDRFAVQHADARTEPLAVNWGLATARGRQLLPVAAGHDGFFYAALRKS